MVKTPTISIVLPTYNRAVQLEQAIKSVLAQTYQDWELLIIDDGSTDETPEIVKKFREADLRIRYLNGFHQGVSAARNLGVQHSQGAFIAFLDDDDLWLPEKLDRQMSLFAAHPEWAFVYTQADLRYADGKPGKPRTPLPVTFEALLGRNMIALPSVLIRKYIIVSLGGFNEAMDVSEDIDLWLRVASRHTFGAIPDALTVCHQSRDRNDARYIRAVKNHLITLEGLLKQGLSMSRRRCVLRKLAKVRYSLARIRRTQGHYFEASREFSRAVRADVAVGLLWQRGWNLTSVVYFMKPYLGIIICLVRGLTTSLNRTNGSEGNLEWKP